MTVSTMDHLEIEPEPNAAPRTAMIVVSDGREPRSQPIALMDATQDIDIEALLTFLPDVQLKKRLDDAAIKALSIPVVGRDGVIAADAALPALREQVATIVAKFEYPCSLANKLHKRLTGLRADFVKQGEAAIDAISKSIYAENKRLDEIGRQEALERQRVADEQAREDARAAAATARKAGAAEEIVEAIERHAETATAPPVPSRGAAPLANTTTVEKWKAKLFGAPDTNPQPSTSEMTAAQQEQAMRLLDAVRSGDVSLCAVEINWKYLDAKAAKEKSTFALPGIAAYDAGSTRSKRR